MQFYNDFYLHMIWHPEYISDGCSVTVLYTRHSTVSHHWGVQGALILKTRLQTQTNYMQYKVDFAASILWNK